MGAPGHGATVSCVLRIIQRHARYVSSVFSAPGYVGPGQRVDCMWLARELVQHNTVGWSALKASFLYFFHRWPSS